MKDLRDLRPCDHCGGPVRQMFYIIRVSLAFVNPQAVNEYLGIHQFFGGKASDDLVRNFAPAMADAVTVAGDQEPSLQTEIAICQACFMAGDTDLPMLMERRQRAAAGEVQS
jgi:hypothetical protein